MGVRGLKKIRKFLQRLLLFTSALLAFALTFLFPAAAGANIRYPFEGFEQRLERYTEIDWTHIKQTYDAMKITSIIQTNNYIPMDMTPTSQESKVFTRILSKSVGHWMNSDEFKSTAVGSTAHQIESHLNTQVALQGANGSTQHFLDFQVDPATTRAQLKYKGLGKATLSYNFVERSVNFEMTQKLSGSTVLVYSVQSGSIDVSSILGVKWTF